MDNGTSPPDWPCETWNNMREIEFLPIEYRQKHARRQSQPWQVVVAAAIVGLVGVAATVQYYARRAAQADLAVITPVYESAVDQRAQIEAAQKRLGFAQDMATLYVYLRHPWPRTQLLAALVNPLPETITLQQIQILREMPAQSAAAPRKIADRKTEEARLQAMTPAQRDLEKLAAHSDSLHTIVIITGTATEIAALHAYVSELDATDIFNKAELDCFDTLDDGQNGPLVQFRAVLAVQPGYGQPDGPHGKEKKS